MNKLTITQEMIESGMSDNGALSFKQINLLGVGRYSGWRMRAIGSEIVEENYQKFLSLKNVHLKKKHKNSVLLDKALAFILDNFTDSDGEFYCPYDPKYCPDEAFVCRECKIQEDFNNIFNRPHN